MKSTLQHAMMALALTPAALAQNPTNNATYRPTVTGASNEIIVRIVPVRPEIQDHPLLAQQAIAPGMLPVSRQDPAYQEAPAQAVPMQQLATSVIPQSMILRDGTPVRLRLTRTLSSAQVKTGDQIDFEVLDDVTVAGQIVIPRGERAIGAVTEAEHKKWAARGGKLNLALQYVPLQDGTKVALRAESDNKGGGHVGAMTAGMAAAVILGAGLPAPLFLFIHGKEAVVPMGTELTAYVNGDTRLGPSVVASR